VTAVTKKLKNQSTVCFAHSTMTSTLLRKYDELVRCTNVLTEGIELEFLKFVQHQEKCRKKWETIEEEHHESKKIMAKHKADQDTLEVKLKMARHQLDGEIKKRLKAEQSVEHMARQLELIKELLLDKDTISLSDADKKALAHSIHQYNNTIAESRNVSLSGLHQSYTMEESSFDLPDSEYDISEDDILDETGASMLGDRRKSKRGHPSAPPLNPSVSPHDSCENDYGKRTRVSGTYEKSSQKMTRFQDEEIISNKENINSSLMGHKTLQRVERDFERPPKPEKRPPSKNHIHEFVGASSSSALSDSYDTDEQYDKNNPIESDAVPDEKVANIYPSLVHCGLGTPPPGLSPSKKLRAHNFVTKIAVKMETCGPCKKKVRFGSNVAKCKECKAVCHSECKDRVNGPCEPTRDTPSKREGTIEAYIDAKRSPQVPDIVLQCIAEIEQRGLQEQGLYRIPGSDKEVKELRDKFLRKKSIDLSKVADIHVLCGCLKDFLRGLSEPLVTFSLHESFRVAATIADPDECLSAMYQCISELPQANRETLATIIIHLQKVSNSLQTQMNTSNLSKIFGPTLVCHRSTNPTHEEMLEDTKHQKEVVARLLEIEHDFWNQYLYGAPSTSPPKLDVKVKTPPYNPNFKSPRTPECKEAPGSLLGTVDPMSQTKPKTKRAYNAMTPKVVSKDGKGRRHFFNSPS